MLVLQLQFDSGQCCIWCTRLVAELELLEPTIGLGRADSDCKTCVGISYLAYHCGCGCGGTRTRTQTRTFIVPKANPDGSELRERR